ncbi:Clp protease N-terminal domain-containing protein [Modestobacter versicolor]|uniref:Clp protease N-terminal domain-containing protein n=1 Tax=Modestobacter versicolor TaxID=429133 RepID=UPI0034DF2242
MGLADAVRDMRTIKALMTGAEAEARSRGEQVPGPEHLLLAATALPDGTAARALRQVGVDAEQLRQAIDRVHADALAPLGIGADPLAGAAADLRGPATGPLRSTPQAQQVFQEAVALSKSTRPSRLRGAHVVVAASRLDAGTLPRALAGLGVDRAGLRAAASAEAGTD